MPDEMQVGSRQGALMPGEFIADGRFRAKNRFAQDDQQAGLIGERFELATSQLFRTECLTHQFQTGIAEGRNPALFAAQKVGEKLIDESVNFVAEGGAFLDHAVPVSRQKLQLFRIADAHQGALSVEQDTGHPEQLERVGTGFRILAMQPGPVGIDRIDGVAMPNDCMNKVIRKGSALLATQK